MDFYSNFSPRTDMADEAHNFWQSKAGDGKNFSGIKSSTESINGLELKEIHISDEQAERAIGKARGRYFSLSLPRFFERGSEDFPAAAGAVAQLIKSCAGEAFGSVLVAALGNPDITPDALGNLAAASILVTRHLDRAEFPGFKPLALCRPGVLGTSGIESAEQVKTLCELIRPELVIVIDALAGSEAERLCRCVQISDAGISPGSGVGNDRRELSRQSLGLPVIAIGIPTVIDAGLFGGEAYRGMFVTPRNIDSLVRAGARVIGYGINMAVQGLSVEDTDALVG